MSPRFCFFFIISCLLLLSCSHNRQVKAEIIELNKIVSITVEFNISDVGYDSNSRTIYLAEELKDYISIYQDFKFSNKFGGKGNNNSSFQLLTDLEVSDNGSLLALDNLQKRISIFDKNGIYRNSISLKNYSNPTKFTLGSDDLLYLYDKNEQEIIILNLLTSQEFMRFAKFEIDPPQAIRFSGNHLTVTNKDRHTDFFNSLGAFVEKYPYLTVKDSYQNTLSLQNNFIFSNGQPKTPIIVGSVPKGMFLKQNNLIIYTQNEVLIYNIKYNSIINEK